MKNTLLVLVFVIWNAPQGSAQNKKLLTGFTGGLISTQVAKTGLTQTGFTTSTEIEYNFSKRWWVVGELEFQMLNYVKTVPGFVIEGKISIVPVKVGVRYLLTDKKVSLYAVTGAGVAFVSSPTATLSNATINIGSVSKSVFAYHVGLGLHWKFKPTFFPFLETNFNQFIGENEVATQKFSQFSVRVGVRTYLF